MMNQYLRWTTICMVILAGFTSSAAAEPQLRKFDGNRPQVVVPRDDGRVMLFPDTAEFYGVEIRINPDNSCIAWWSKAADHIAWQVELPKAGDYEVWIEWSIADDLAGNTLLVTTGDQQLSAKIGKSGGWTDFKRASWGILKLAEGKHRLKFSVGGKLNGEVADIRAVTLNPVGVPAPPGAPDVPAQSPAESLNSIQVHPAMQVELVAAEPLIRDPIAIAWGADQKLWVVEMGDYPLGIESKGAHGGRIRFLEDTNADGHYDKATLFLNGLDFPTAVLPWRRGVLVACAPDIFFAEDTTGDGRADVIKKLITGFPERNQQHRINGLRWGLDNWVHCANGDGGVGGDTKITCVKTGRQLTLGSRDLRFHPDTGEFEPTSGPSQFGRNRDDWGNWFGSNNAQPLYHFALDEHYLARNPRLSPPDSRVHLLNVGGPYFALSPAIAFHGQQTSLIAAKRATGMGGACSGAIYRDDLLGDKFVGNAFTCDPVTNLVHRSVLTAAGATFSAQRAGEEAESEFFATSDPWTRPTMVQTGPDGALYVVDMYRLYIEHPQWIHPSVLERADLRAGCDRGRIYRIYPRNTHPRPAERLDRLDTEALVRTLDNPNGWQRDVVQQLLFERQDHSAIPTLAKTVAESIRPQTRLQAMAVLAGLNAITEDILLVAIRDTHPAVRRWAIQLAEPHLDRSAKLAAAVVACADDDNLLVVMQVACSLGEWNNRAAGTQIGRLIAAHRDEPLLVTAALSSATKQPAALLLAVIGAVPPPDEALLTRVVAACASAENHDFEAAIVQQIQSEQNSKESSVRFTLLAALLDSATLSPASRQQLLDNSPQFFQQARAIVADDSASPAMRVAAMRVLARQDKLRAADVAQLVALVDSTVALPLAQAAIDRLAQLDDTSIGADLAHRLRQIGPALRSRVFDAIFSRNTWTEALLKHFGENESLAASLDPTRRQQLLTHSDEQLRTTAEQIFGAVKTVDRQALVSQYATAVREAGDVERGRAVFKANCAACHRLDDAGNEVGPNLTGLRDKSPQVLLEAILNPNRAVEDKFVAYNAATIDGRVYSGLIQSESDNGINLMAADGRAIAILRSELETLVSTGRSLMPDGFEKTIPPAAMADLLSYLTHPTSKAIPSRSPGVVAETIMADSNGTIRLLATQATLLGGKVGINAQAECIAWMVEGDQAEWRIEIPQAAEYSVHIEWAQIDELTDNPFVLEVADERIAGKFPSTHGWDKYQSREFGRLTLPAGSTGLVLKPNGPVKTELADIRSITLKPTTRE